MRFIFGLIIGFLLAIALSYLHDAPSGLFDPATQPQRVVNWTVLDSITQEISDSVRSGWNRLTGHHEEVATPPAPTVQQ